MLTAFSQDGFGDEQVGRKHTQLITRVPVHGQRSENFTIHSSPLDTRQQTGLTEAGRGECQTQLILTPHTRMKSFQTKAGTQIGFNISNLDMSALICVCVRTLVNQKGEFSITSNGVRQKLKIQMALRHKSGLSPVQWQCRFRTLARKVFFMLKKFVFMFYLYLTVMKVGRKQVEFQSAIQ